MQTSEKANRAAWRIARRALETGEWAHTQRPQRAAELVDFANVVTTSLAAAGCLADKYGEGGSLEIEIAAGYVAKHTGHVGVPTYGTGALPQAPLAWYAEQIFQHVRDLDATGLLTQEDRKRARTFEADVEAAREAKRKAAEEAREAKRRQEEERQERIRRREAAARRLAEIEREKEAK